MVADSGANMSVPLNALLVGAAGGTHIPVMVADSGGEGRVRAGTETLLPHGPVTLQLFTAQIRRPARLSHHQPPPE